MKRFFCVMLSFFLCVYSVIPAVFGGDTSVRNHRAISIEELQNMTYDPDAFDALVQEITENMQEKSQKDTVESELEALWEMYLLLETKMELSSIATYRDVTDEVAAEEYREYMALYYDAGDRLGMLIPEVLESPCREAVDETLYGDFLYGGGYSDEDMALVYEEQDLVDAYYAALNQEYTVEYQGDTYTQSEADAAWTAWELSDDAYDEICTLLAKAQNDATADYYVQLVENRGKQAEGYGYRRTDRFYDVMYYGREITQRQREELYRGVKNSVVPVLGALEERITQLYETVDYWDTYSGQRLIPDLEQGVSMISEEFLPALSYMTEFGYYDIEAGENKAPTTFTTYLDYPDAPYLMMNPSGTSYDFSTIVHEFGHYYAFYISPDPNMYNLDLAEIHSQGLELLMLRHYETFFGEYAEIEELSTVYNILVSLVDGCMFDELERYAYCTENLTVDAMNEKYMGLLKEYGYRAQEDTATEAYGWVGTAHLFDYPLYYLSYGISASAALGLWENAQEDYDKAVEDYLSLVALGEAGSFTDTLGEIGMKDPLSAESLNDLAECLIDVYGFPLSQPTLAETETEEEITLSDAELGTLIIVFGVAVVVWLVVTVIVMVWAVRKEKKRREEYRKYIYRRTAMGAYRGTEDYRSGGDQTSPAGGEVWWLESGDTDDRPETADPSVPASEEDESSGFDG